MRKITNSHGVSIDYDAAVELMDADLREEIHSTTAPCSAEDFFRAYCAAHVATFGEPFAPDARSPRM